MDDITQFDIELDKCAYYAGEVLTGHVIVENSENIKVQAIRLFIRGKSHCEWKITRAGEKRTVKDDELYIDHKQVLWGKGATDDGPVPILPRGLHRLPIEYQLPESNLPCSFESKIGQIRYYIRVVINIPYASHPQGIKYFSVLGPHIDCMNSMYLTPTTATDKRKSCCFCVLGGPMMLKAIMERSAYCCGEKIKLKAEVQNGCDSKVWLLCQFVQHVEYFINRGVLGLTKEYTYKVWEYESERVQPHRTVVFNKLQDHLQVPVTPPTLIDVCGLVKIYYELTIFLCTDRSTSSLDVTLPVTVATVPFRIPNTPSPQLHFEYPSPNVEGGRYISPEFQLGQVYMGDDIEENDKTIIYRPVYCSVLFDDEAPPVTQHQSQPRKVPKIVAYESPKQSPRTSPSVSPKSSVDFEQIGLLNLEANKNESSTDDLAADQERLVDHTEHRNSPIARYFRRSSTGQCKSSTTTDPRTSLWKIRSECPRCTSPLLQHCEIVDTPPPTKTCITMLKNTDDIETISLKFI